MLNVKKKLSQRGFSLIELMVAVAILAMAIFGIFHAYSAGFMGMADARDRTVATNYAREAMEDIKNKDFDQIVPQSRNFVNGTKYEREVIVQESTNLKKINTKVYWQDRDGAWKIVETDMVIHFIEKTAGIPTRIMLIANPYNVLTEDNVSTTDVYENRSFIAAVVKDVKGNTVTTYNNNITFTLNDSNDSSLIDSSGNTIGKIYSINAVEGIATVTFQASDTEGDIIIEASDSGLTYDSVTIKVTDPDKPVKINLTASPIFMIPESISIITATVVNAGGATVENATNEITFSVSDPDLGTLSNQSFLILGVATIDLNSSATPSTITVTASASGLEPGVVDVITGGKVSLSASPTTVPIGEKSEITVTTKDVNGVPINYAGTINLNVNGTGSGTLPSDVTFDGSASSLIVTFTATSEGTVNIDAEDDAGILTSADQITLDITLALIPHHIDVSAEPNSIEAGGTDTSMITARIKTDDNINVTSYSELIVFSTDLGTFPNESTTIDTSDLINVYYVNGVASVELNAASDIGTATITVTSGSLIPGIVEVGFYIEADNILLKAVPQNILAGGQSCTITATIRDGETTVSNYNSPVTFTIMEGYPSGVKFSATNQSSITITAESGKAHVDLESKNWTGTAKIKATASEGIPPVEGFLNIPVGISLNLVDGTVSYIDDTISFDIEVLGADLLLEEIQVSWDSPSDENLNRIEVNGTLIFYIGDESNDPIGSITYTDELITVPNVRIADVNVEDITLSTGVSSVKLYFNAEDNMSGKNMEVIFNPNSGEYLVDFTVP